MADRMITFKITKCVC